MKAISTLFCFVFAVSANIHPVHAQVNVQDSLALVDLYDSTDGANWVHSKNWLTGSPVSTWYGITVTNGEVTTIDIRGNRLNGSIPTSIGNLENLKTLSLFGNKLSGVIPASIGNLKSLQTVWLSSNRLSGAIPSSIGNLVNLTDLDLSANQLSDSIPSSIGNLVNLTTLHVFN